MPVILRDVFCTYFQNGGADAKGELLADAEEGVPVRTCAAAAAPGLDAEQIDLTRPRGKT